MSDKRATGSTPITGREVRKPDRRGTPRRVSDTGKRGDYYDAYVGRVKSALMQSHEGHTFNKNMTKAELLVAYKEIKHFIDSLIEGLT